MNPELLFVGASAVSAAVGALALRRERRSADVTADRFTDRLAIHPARGLTAGAGRVLVGEVMAGLSPVDVSSPVVEATITQVRPALDSRPTCQGTLTAYPGGTTVCCGGWADCLGADSGYVHGRTVVGAS